MLRKYLSKEAKTLVDVSPKKDSQIWKVLQSKINYLGFHKENVLQTIKLNRLINQLN